MMWSRRRSPAPLANLTSHCVATLLFKAFKYVSHPRRRSETFSQAQIELHGLLVDLGYLVSREIVAVFVELVIQEKDLLHTNFFSFMGFILCNEFTRRLRLDSSKLFQCSSMALEATLADFKRVKNLTHLHMAFEVIDLICFDFRTTLNNLAAIEGLRSLALPGLRSVIEDEETMLLFVSTLCVNSNCTLHTLDLSYSMINDECLVSHLSTLPHLSELNVDETSVTTLGLNVLLEKNMSLRTLSAHPLIPECLRSLNSRSSLENLSMLFEPQSQPDILQQKLPNLKSVLIKTNGDVVEQWPGCVDEHLYLWYTSSLKKEVDPGPKEESRVADVDIKLQFRNLNLLLLIKTPRMHMYGSLIVEVELVGCDFVHSQCLNALASDHLCPKLSNLSIIQCSIVQDDLFVGAIPQLSTQPFKNLHSLVIESTTVSHSLASFLLVHSTELRLLKLQPRPEVDETQLRMLLVKPKSRLERLRLLLGAKGDEEVDQVEKTLHTLMDGCSNLKSIELITFHHRLEPALMKLQKLLRDENFDVELKYFILHQGKRRR